jgi:uncharacterized phage protein gp47/JayE
MPFSPKTAGDILRQLTAAVVGRSRLSDVNPGSSLLILLQAFAEELASTERRLFTVRESFFLNGSVGQDLDRRVSELPPAGITRINKTHASGTVLRIERDPLDIAEALVIPVGSIFGSASGVRYRTTVQAIIPMGDADIDNVHIIAESPGRSGNAAINIIARVISAPDQVIKCRNTQPITNGLDVETDEDLRNRAAQYLKSLSRCQAATIEFMASSFISSEGERFPYAKLYEDPEQYGFCELVIDDGSGISKESLSRVGRTSINNIATGGSRVAYHEGPATGPILPEQIIVHVGGNPNTQIAVTDINYTSIYERGIIYFKPGVVNPGDRVFIQNYRVYRGYVAELQREVEGDPNSLDRVTGFRAAGTRIIVNTVTPQFVDLDLSLTADPTADYDSVEAAISTLIEAFINRLAPGQTLFISQLIDLVVNEPGVIDVKFFERNSAVRADNVDTSSARHALRIKAGSILITTSSRG